MEDHLSVFIGLGANQGDRFGNLRRAARSLEAHPTVTLMEASPVYETKPHTLMPDTEMPDYLNAVTGFSTSLAPLALLDICQVLEREAGRERDREQRWGPRPLDLDLLAIGTLQRHTDRLTLPHPRLVERRFVLQPWADVAPQFRVPAPFNATVAELLERCSDQHDLRRLHKTLL